MIRQNIVFFTGAGVSAESGIPTFRDANNGLWKNYDPELLCTASGFYENPKGVLEFYNELRKNLLSVEPNAAHRAIAELEKIHHVTVITQNVDNLHERAGSTHVIHLHGELTKVTSSKNRLDPNCIKEKPLDEQIRVGEMAPDGSQVRPFVVFFDEYVDWDDAKTIAKNADVFAIIGTSMSVSTSLAFPRFPRHDVPRYIIDPLNYCERLPEGYIWIEASATEGMKILTEEFTNGFQLFERIHG